MGRCDERLSGKGGWLSRWAVDAILAVALCCYWFLGCHLADYMCVYTTSDPS